MMTTTNRKTLRRTRGQAKFFAQMKRDAGHTNVTIKRVTATDWAITWTEKPRA